MMSTKCSHSILAALVLCVTPAFAQEAKAPEPSATIPAQVDAAADKTKEAVDAAAEAAEKVMNDAAKGVEAATSGAADAAASETTEATGTDAPAGEAATEAPATTESPAAKPTTAPAPAPAPAAPATPADPQIGQPYKHSEHGDWTINCVKLGQGADPCVLNQLLKDEADSPVAEISFVPLSGGEVAAGGTLVAPLETDLVRGIGIRIDDGESRGYQFNVCTAPDGCIARIGFSAQELQQFKRGAKATVTLLPYGADPKSPVNLTMSLSGFTAGFDELVELLKEAPKPAE